MRRIVLPILSLLAIACSSEIDEEPYEVSEEVTVVENPDETAKEETSEGFIEEPANKVPVFEKKSFSIDEHSAVGTSIGFLAATDANQSPMTYTLESGADIDIDENTGEMKVGQNLNLDFERTENIEFSILAFDGKITTEKTIFLNIQNVDEMVLLTAHQKELISYFQYLTLWKGPYVTEVEVTRKWTIPMILHLDGTITDEYRSTVESVISQYNALFTEGDFGIILTENADDANASLFFGAKEDVAAVWPDMYNLIKDGNYDGYAKTPSHNSIMTATRIWISNPIEALLKHELGHALGFGHSNHCNGEKSIMCSSVSAESVILPVEADVIRYQYHRDMPSGLSESEIEQVLANLILIEE